MSCFSFYSNKTITSGEGGMIVTKNKKFFNKLKLYSNVGFSKKRFIHYIPGFNLRYTALQASLAYSQFQRIKFTLEKKKFIFSMYKKFLSKNKYIKFQETSEKNKNTYYGSILNLSKKISKILSRKN